MSQRERERVDGSLKPGQYMHEDVILAVCSREHVKLHVSWK